MNPTPQPARRHWPLYGLLVVGLVVLLLVRIAWATTGPSLLQTACNRLPLAIQGGWDITVKVRPAPEDRPPDARPPELPAPPSPGKALGVLAMRNGRCTATPILPRRPDGRFDILTAAHCLPEGERSATFRQGGGPAVACTLQVIDRKADLAWLVTDTPVDGLHAAALAPALPPVGTAVWHAGFGTDQPGNREDGQVVGQTADKLQLAMQLSVSPGDSGGGIFRSDTGHLVAVVCCTTRLAGRGLMFGGHALRAAALRPGRGGAAGLDVPPVQMPAPPPWPGPIGE